MAGDASLARLFRDHGQQWEIEKITRGCEWVAVRRDEAGALRILSARDIGALRYRIEAAERADAGGHDDPSGRQRKQEVST